MNVPKRRVQEHYVGNDDIVRIDKFNKIRPSVHQSPCPPHIPPDITLAINGPILTYHNNLTRAINIHTFVPRTTQVNQVCNSLYIHFKRARWFIPVITTSWTPSPWIKLTYLPPGRSLPLPYDGNGSITGQFEESWTSNREKKKKTKA